MRTREATFKSQTGLIIYITSEEKNSPEVIREIEEYKKYYRNISVFISGSKDLKNTLKQIVADKFALR